MYYLKYLSKILLHGLIKLAGIPLNTETKIHLACHASPASKTKKIRKNGAIHLDFEYYGIGKNENIDITKPGQHHASIKTKISKMRKSMENSRILT
jgi:hypothetical protein